MPEDLAEKVEAIADVISAVCPDNMPEHDVALVVAKAAVRAGLPASELQHALSVLYGPL